MKLSLTCLTSFLIFVCQNVVFGQINDCSVFTPFSFGVIADCQCGSGDCSSIPKMEEAIDYYNNQTDIEFCVHLGDFIETNIDNYDLVQPIYESLNVPHYFALGNHEFDVPNSEKANIKDRLNMPDYYYSWKVYNWRFMVINSTDLAFYTEAIFPDSVEERDSIFESDSKNKTNAGALSKTQLNWIESTISTAKQANENVVLFAHHPVFPADARNVWNDEAFIEILEKYDNVVAFMNGHVHVGNYGEKNGIHYLTYKAMKTHTNSYSVVEVVRDTLYVKGFGEADSYTLTYKAKTLWQDADNDSVCDEDDVCNNFNDLLIGEACDDNNPCTILDLFTNECNCEGRLSNLTASYTTQPVSSAIFNDGAIDVFVSGGVAPYNYEWSNNATTKNLDNIVMGDYALTITDAQGCFIFIDDIQVDNNCVEELNINQPTALSSGMYYADALIKSNQIIEADKTIEYNARNCIELSDSFEVKQGAQFDAKIGGCVR